MPQTSGEVKKETRQEGVCQMLPVLFQKERKQPPRGESNNTHVFPNGRRHGPSQIHSKSHRFFFSTTESATFCSGASFPGRLQLRPLGAGSGCQGPHGEEGSEAAPAQTQKPCVLPSPGDIAHPSRHSSSVSGPHKTKS